MKSKIFISTLVAIFLFCSFSHHATAQINCCVKPDSLKVTSVTATSVCVSWHKADSAQCDSITSGTFRYRKVGTLTWIGTPITYGLSNIITFCDTASPCTSYQWQVRNVCKKGDTVAYSGFVSGPDFTTSCPTCCKTPDSLKVLSVTDSSFCVSWHVTDSIPCDSIIRGFVGLREVGTTLWHNTNLNYHGTLGTITFCDTASPCTSYEWRVRNTCQFVDSTFPSTYITGPVFTTKCDTTRLLPKAGIPVKVYPNPAKGSIILTGNYASASNLLIVVTDMTGNKRMEQKAQVFNKGLNLSLDISRLPKGVYFITVSDGKTVSKTNFVKED